jgi:polyisoprenoid-binding protein YceI
VTGSHNGGFKTFSGYFHVLAGGPVGDDHIFTTDMSSTWSDDDKLTGHLKSPDFFDKEKFPESKFEVTGIGGGADSMATVSGDFTLHGVTKNISFPASMTKGDNSMRMGAKFDINRKDFEINYPGKTDDLIRDEVVIELDVEAKPEM